MKNTKTYQLLAVVYFAVLASTHAQGFDWAIGDKQNNTGKFTYGTFTRFPDGSISGTGTTYRHGSRSITLVGNENSRIFTATWVERRGRRNITKSESVTIPNLSKTTVVTYRGSFTTDGKVHEFFAIQRP